MKEITIIFLIFHFLTSCQAQTVEENRQFLEKFVSDYTEYSFIKPDDLKLEVSDQLLNLNLDHLVIENPYEDSYPVSYSVVINNNLISLFEPGNFVCIDLATMARNTDFEKLLNTKKFKYHWLIDGELTAVSGVATFKWENSKWIKSNSKLPVDKQPKYFEDADFLVFGDCHGEWGGTVYFLDKKSDKVYFTESTCTNTVYSKNGEYYVFAHLGHGFGSAELKVISDPRKLSVAKRTEINKMKDGDALGYKDKSGAFQEPMNFYGIQFFSTFEYDNRQLYLGHLRDLTFLAEIKKNQIQIVHPLFKNEIYTHDPVTSTDTQAILINLDHYGTAREREVSCLIIKDGQLTKLDWNENQSR